MNTAAMVPNLLYGAKGFNHLKKYFLKSSKLLLFLFGYHLTTVID